MNDGWKRTIGDFAGGSEMDKGWELEKRGSEARSAILSIYGQKSDDSRGETIKICHDFGSTEMRLNGFGHERPSDARRVEKPFIFVMRHIHTFHLSQRSGYIACLRTSAATEDRGRGVGVESGSGPCLDFLSLFSAHHKARSHTSSGLGLGGVHLGANEGFVRNGCGVASLHCPVFARLYKVTNYDEDKCRLKNSRSIVEQGKCQDLISIITGSKNAHFSIAFLPVCPSVSCFLLVLSM